MLIVVDDSKNSNAGRLRHSRRIRVIADGAPGIMYVHVTGAGVFDRELPALLCIGCRHFCITTLWHCYYDFGVLAIQNITYSCPKAEENAYDACCDMVGSVLKSRLAR